MVVRRVLLGAVAGCAVVGLIAGPGAPPGEAGLADLKALVSKHEHGPWEPMFQDVNLDAGQARNLYLKVKVVHSDTSFSSLLWQHSDEHPYKTKYFKGEQNITSDVNTFTSSTPSGYEFTAKPDKYRKFRLKVISETDSTPGRCITQGWAFEGSLTQDDTTNTGINGICV
jgi:hypothetical protein